MEESPLPVSRIFAPRPYRESATHSSELIAAWECGQRPDRDKVRCPHGHEYVYPVAVRVDQGGAVTEVTHSGARSRSGGMKSEDNFGRGAVIEVEFNCEEGCKFVLAFEFYKGWTFASFLLGHAELLPNDELTLWRN